MNNKYIPYSKLFVPLTFMLLMLVQLVKAQSGSFGNTFVAGGAEFGIVGVQHNFQNGGSGVLPGTVGTERTAPQGFLSFSGTASVTGAADNAHVDGYVKTYMTTAFTFPIGDNGKYRPAAVSAASLANPANAAYFGVSASTAVTTSIKGGNEPVLPTGGPFSTASKGSGVNTVDNVEYWDINGAASAKITLTWDATSAVSTLTNSTLSNLSILGWDGTKWVSIPSTVDATSLLGGTSSLTTGSITTTAAIVPNTYTVYTLGSLVPPCVAGTTAPAITATTISNTCPATTFSLASLANTGTKPTGTTLIWSTNKVPTSASDTLTNLTTVSTAGKYYALYYDKANSCYSPADSVTATLTICANNPAGQSATTNQAKTGNAGTELTPTGGTSPYSYSVDNSGTCTPVVGATALPTSSNLTVTNTATGAYSYTAPATAGTYYYCIKVCDSATPTASCVTKTYTLSVASPSCAVGTVIPGIK